MHEFVASGARRSRRKKAIRAMDIAKRLLDYGFHAPTVYFPLVVPEALMMEPTETESKETLDAFAEALFEDQRRRPRAAARRPAHHPHQPPRRSPSRPRTSAELEELNANETNKRE